MYYLMALGFYDFKFMDQCLEIGHGHVRGQFVCCRTTSLDLEDGHIMFKIIMYK
jgi:hypothetical protein